MNEGGRPKLYKVDQPQDADKVDLGPDSDNKYTLEIYMRDKTFTLYTDNSFTARDFHKRIM